MIYNRSMLIGFSLIELLVVITIIGILMSIAIPSYNQYIIKAKMLDIFNFANTYKLNITEDIIHGYNIEEINNKVVDNPNKLVTKLEYFINPQEKKYSFKITPNTKVLGIPMTNNNPLIIEFTAQQELENNLLIWDCQYTKGYTAFLPKTCKDTL